MRRLIKLLGDIFCCFDFAKESGNKIKSESKKFEEESRKFAANIASDFQVFR